jgi:predicted TPR repeat methyltransferase
MTKLTPAQAQAAQAKADRRAAAAERRDGAIAADNARVADLFKAAEVAKKAADLAHAVYTLSELETIPDAEVRERCLKLAAIWAVAEPNVPFPGVGCWFDRMAKDGRFNWYLHGDNLAGDLPAMVCSNGRLTQDRAKRGGPVGRLGYRYSTVTVRTALQRAMKGKPLFNYAD